MQLLLVTVLVSFAIVSANQPPGVPPRQNQPHQGQQQQHQQQQNQQHQQQGGHGHGHGHHGKPLEFASEVHNADHILEHLEKVVATKSKDEMTEEELEFHYFKLHDYDGNNKLDGVEIGKALTHFHDGEGKAQEDAKIFGDGDISNIVDSVIDENDENKDGYIEYFEFKRRQVSSKDNKNQGNQRTNTQQQHG